MIRFTLVIFVIFTFASVVRAQSDTTGTHYGKWGFGMELGPCTGMYFLTGEAKENISEGWCYANVGITVSYNKFHFIMQTGGISGSLKRSLSYGPEWKKDHQFGTAHLQLSVGYELLCTRHFNIIPFVSGGMTAFNTRRDTTGSYDVADTRWKPSYSVGSAFDFKMNFPLFKKNREPDVEYSMGYLYFRVLTGIYPTYFQNPLDIQGGMYFVNLSVGFYASGRPEVSKRK